VSALVAESGTMSAPRFLNGGCLCDVARYAVADEFAYAQNCHCSDCHRATGSALKPFGGTARAKLRLTQGEADLLRHGGDQAHDVHCRVCGSLLFSEFPPREWVHVTIGTLHDAPSLRPTAHIWVSDKAPWFTITDNLPQQAGFPP
jgi:hypothetical protein